MTKKDKEVEETYEEGFQKKQGKGYGILALWVVALTLIPLLLVLILEGSVDEVLLMKIILVSCAIMIWLLMWYINKSQRLYWINGYRYKQVIEMSSQLRQALTSNMLKIFSLYTGSFILYSIVSIVIGLNTLVDTLVFTLGAIVMAFHSYYAMMKIEKNDKGNLRNM